MRGVGVKTTIVPCTRRLVFGGNPLPFLEPKRKTFFVILRYVFHGKIKTRTGFHPWVFYSTGGRFIRRYERRRVRISRSYPFRRLRPLESLFIYLPIFEKVDLHYYRLESSHGLLRRTISLKLSKGKNYT